MPTERSSHGCIPPDHPSVAGHFPGKPVVPGVVILEAVIAAAESWRPGRTVTGMPSVKFMHPLKPGARFRIRLVEETDKLEFTCFLDERILVAGELILA